MWDELSGGIIILLKTLSTVDNTVAIFDYAMTNIPAYPAITVTGSDSVAQFADTTRNQRSYKFAIRCYQERVQAGEQLSESIVRKLADSVITLFDANPFLDQVNGFGRLNGRGFCRPIPSVWKYIQSEQIDVRMTEVLLECVVIQ